MFLSKSFRFVMSISFQGVHVGFAVDEVALGRAFLQVLRFPLSDSKTYLCGIYSEKSDTGTGFSHESKAIPVQAWIGPECSKSLRLPDFKAIGKVVSPTHRPSLPP
jgi:hypothetical protein